MSLLTFKKGACYTKMLLSLTHTGHTVHACCNGSNFYGCGGRLSLIFMVFDRLAVQTSIHVHGTVKRCFMI